MTPQAVEREMIDGTSHLPNRGPSASAGSCGGTRQAVAVLYLTVWAILWCAAPLSAQQPPAAEPPKGFQPNPVERDDVPAAARAADVLDIVLGTAIAYIVLRTRVFGRQWLDYMATAALAVPGVVIGIGYLRTFHDISLPFLDQPMASWWFIIVIALTIRRLPYALRACMAALQQVSVMLEEAAENLGCRWRCPARRR